VRRSQPCLDRSNRDVAHNAAKHSFHRLLPPAMEPESGSAPSNRAIGCAGDSSLIPSAPFEQIARRAQRQPTRGVRRMPELRAVRASLRGPPLSLILRIMARQPPQPLSPAPLGDQSSASRPGDSKTDESNGPAG